MALSQPRLGNWFTAVSNYATIDAIGNGLLHVNTPVLIEANDELVMYVMWDAGLVDADDKVTITSSRFTVTYYHTLAA